MTLEQFKENSRLGIVTEENSIEAILNAFGELPLTELFHKNMRSIRFDQMELLSEILDAAQIPMGYAGRYHYHELAEILFCTIMYDNLPEQDGHPDYLSTAPALDELSRLPSRFVPSYRKRKGV